MKGYSLLLQLQACNPCGVERKFVLRDGALACSICGVPMEEQRLHAALDPRIAATVAGLQLLDAALSRPPSTSQPPVTTPGCTASSAAMPGRPAAGSPPNRAPAEGRGDSPMTSESTPRQAARSSILGDSFGELVGPRGGS